MPWLFITVRFHDGRYHGLDTGHRAEWPPSPARLFQALVAAAAQGAVLSDEDRDALMWLEKLEAQPIIAAPAVREGQYFSHFMPNNALDVVEGDSRRVGKIRTASKRFHPRIFDREALFLYAWTFDQGTDSAERICHIAEQLYQLGRGVDMAWAVAEILDTDKVEACLSAYIGTIYRPAANGGGQSLACPISGSLNSLIDRYRKTHRRFKTVVKPVPNKNESSQMKVEGQIFLKPPKPRFRQIFYNCPAVRRVYELRDMTKKAGFFSWPLKEAVRLVETVRNNAATKLQEALPEKGEIVSRVFGICRDATEADKASRIRIIPLPSVGHPHADHGIRRLLVEIPPNCPLAVDDITWAFSGIGAIDHATGELLWMLVSAEERGMLDNYGIGNVQESFRAWRTVTPIALPVVRPRGRKSGSERGDIERSAATTTAQALRHAGIVSRPSSIRMQREPFDAKGARADDFAPGTRFGPARLWHVEITFVNPVTGPLLAGDGRYLGLGLMKPIKRVEGAHAFVIASGLSGDTDSQSVARGLRRAVMALVQSRLGPRVALPLFFTGHEVDNSPARRGNRSHLAFAFDEVRQRLLVIAPHLLEVRQPSQAERKHLKLLDAALTDLHRLRAGSAGLLELEPSAIVEGDDPLFAHATTWTTQTEYRPTRYSKLTTPEQAIIADVGLELRRRGFPMPASIEQVSVSRGPRGGLSAQLKLVFSSAVSGPLLLGKTCNFGSGLFVAIR